MREWKIVETDNFNGEYPDEKFVILPPLEKQQAEVLCYLINLFCSGNNSPRFWKVEKRDYKLQLGFEP